MKSPDGVARPGCAHLADGCLVRQWCEDAMRRCSSGARWQPPPPALGMHSQYSDSAGESHPGRLEYLLQTREVLAVCAPHRASHDRCGEPGEAAGLASVAQGHPRPAVCGVLPGVGGLHRKRPVGGAHHESLARKERRHLIGVGQAAPDERSDERDPGADREWRLGLLFDALDVLVPHWRVLRFHRVGSYLLSRSADLDLRADVDRHRRYVNTGFARPVSAYSLSLTMICPQV